MKVYIVDEVEKIGNESVLRLESVPYIEVEKFKRQYSKKELPSYRDFTPVSSELIQKHNFRVNSDANYLEKIYEGRVLSDERLPGFADYNSQEIYIEGKRFYLLNCSGYGKKYLTNFYNVSSRVDIGESLNVPNSLEDGIRRAQEPYFFYPINVQQGNSSLLLPWSERRRCYFVDFGGSDFNILSNVVNSVYACFDEVVILLTHWDEDHYNYLRHLTIDQIQKTVVHSPFYPRLTQDAINTLAMIVRSGGDLFLHRELDRNYRLDLFQFQRMNFHQQNVNRGRLNKNNTGISYMFDNFKTIGFPGDSSYNYVNFGKRDFLYSTHHGSAHFGHLRNIPQPKPEGKSIFSFGAKNSYDHPTDHSWNSHLDASWVNLNCDGNFFVV